MDSEDKTLRDSGATFPGGMPERIGRYRLLGQIGEGGFGAVYEAEQTEPVRRRVALKVIKLGMDMKQVIARFEAERQALALMDHANIARVLDAGATENGRPFFVMELVRGEPITHYCDKNNLSIAERLRLFGLVCKAVQHAHQKGIIHRDLKPSNVLITLQDGQPVPKVIDFGIAKATNQQLTEKTVYTEHQMMIGTPEYMSPEQAEMTGIDVDTRSDIYSLGVMLYELITGVTPFESKQLRAAGYAEIQRIIREQTPPKPSTHVMTLETVAEIASHRRTEPGKLGLLIRGDLDWIVMKALEKDRTRRYETANGFAADIQRYLDNEPVEASPPTVHYRMRKFVQRNRGAVVAVSVVGVALVLGIMGTSWGMWRALHAVRAEEAAKREAEQVAAFQAEQLGGIDVPEMAKHLRGELVDRIDKNLEGRDDLSAAEKAARTKELENLLEGVDFVGASLALLDSSVFEGAMRTIDEKFADRPLFQARMLQTLASTTRDLGLLERAATAQTRALAIRREQLGDEDPETLTSLNAMGILERNRGNYKEAERLLRETVEKRRRVLGNDDPATLSSLNELGKTLFRVGRIDEAGAIFREVLQGRRRVLGDDDIETVRSMANMGVLFQVEGHYAEAAQSYRQTFAAFAKLGGHESDALKAKGQLAVDLDLLGRYDEAESMIRDVIEVDRRLWGDDHPQTLRDINNLCVILGDQERFAEEEAVCRANLETCRRVLGDEHNSTLFAMSNLAQAQLGQEHYEKAERLLRAIQARARAIFVQMGEALEPLARVCLATGRDAEALELATKAVGAEAGGNENIWRKFDTLASAQYATGDTAAAVETQRRAIAALPDGFAYQPTIDALNDRLHTYEAALAAGR